MVKSEEMYEMAKLEKKADIYRERRLKK